MKIIKWEDTYRLEIDMFDIQHQYLIKLLNMANSAISLNHNISEIRSISQELLEYTDYHLKSEEEMMKITGYNKLYLHHTEHDIIRNRLAELKVCMVAFDIRYYTDVSHYIEEYYLNHVLIFDKEFADFVKGSS